ncbi:MAG: DUF6340 family protein [Prevotellaceae bacterium]|jgi:hypothetical protein|nr:DUF6340 family protein [Prevotellaceae bacterium]
MKRQLINCGLLGLLLLTACQATEQLSIDYMIPAQVSFPAGLRRVGVVNNAVETPNFEAFRKEENQEKMWKEWKRNGLAHQERYVYGDAVVATEALAEALAAENYFDEVVICDSALRAHDIQRREPTLSRSEVAQLTTELDVDFLIALENLPIRTSRRVEYLSESSALAAIDVKVFPVIQIYQPNSGRRNIVLHATDSIYWERGGSNPARANVLLPDDRQLVREASQFAGSVPVKRILPSWKTAERTLYLSGGANMRDAAVYTREKNWDAAIGLWQQVYNKKNTRKKVRMYAACNLALGYEMKDEFDQARAWILKACDLAAAVYHIDVNASPVVLSKLSLYQAVACMNILQYAAELKGREQNAALLKEQTEQFNNPIAPL